MANTKNSGRVSIECSKCNGRGRIDWSRNDDGVCYSCNGAGSRTISAAEHARNLAAAERMVAARAAEDAEDARIADLYDAASAVIAARGLDGARSFWCAHSTDAAALGALVGALRDGCSHAGDAHPYMIAANKIVAANRARELAA